MVCVQGTKAMISKQQDELDRESGGKPETFGDLDGFPGVQLTRGREIVHRDFIQAAGPLDEVTDFLT
jgi:hypothetical protein